MEARNRKRRAARRHNFGGNREVARSKAAVQAAVVAPGRLGEGSSVAGHELCDSAVAEPCSSVSVGCGVSMAGLRLYVVPASVRDRRPIGVLWSGGFQTPDLPWRDVEGPARQLYQDAFDLAVSWEWIAPLEALDTVLASRGIDLGDPAMSPLREAAGLIDVAVRSTRRFAFLEAVAQSGLPLHICGVGWESQLHRFGNATYEGAVDMTRMVELMRRSRLVLNTNGNFGAGSHERPFSASLAGAATFSDVSRYYTQVFEPGANIELFRWKDLAGGMEQLTSLAADPQRCFDYARSAKAMTLAGHTWDRQIDQILQAGEAVRR